jgi:hypothetical protein
LELVNACIEDLAQGKKKSAAGFTMLPFQTKGLSQKWEQIF